MMKKILYLILFFTQLFAIPYGHAFIVKQIQFDGLQHITPQTVENYLPLKRGQNLDPAKTGEVIRALYQTGFFDQIRLSHDKGTLIIHVVERPTIGQLKISGNSIIPTDKLTTVMRGLDVAEGRIYNPVILEKIKQSLLNQYYQLGRYNAAVTINTSPMTRNRVAVNIVISEGLVAKIRRISIVGNHVFDEQTLIKQMDITTSGLFTFFTEADRYSDEKLEQNLEKIRSYYMDHGYIRFNILSSQAEITPDRKGVYITIAVQENDLYKVSSYKLTGKLVLPREVIDKQIKLAPGDVFSRQKVLDSEKAITNLLGNEGYMYAKVVLRPQVDDKTHDLILIYDVQPGKRIYVRQVTFSENNRTNDVVLRREIEQMEAAPASISKLQQSKQRLSLLPYIKNVEMSLQPVPEIDDQLDVDYKVKEDSSAQATFKIGYSQVDGFVVGAGLNQKNVLGTGNTLGLNFSGSKVEKFFGIDYTDPYYTADGISRTFNLSASRIDPGAISRVNSSYTINEYNLGVLYGIPVGQEQGVFSRILAGISYQNVLINIVSGKESNQVASFVSDHGRHFQEIDFRLGFSRDSRDRAIFPNKGIFQSVFLDVYAPADQNSLSFYALNYHGKWYEPLSEQFIILTRADFGYGNGFHGIEDFPFFKNYYAGGISTVRGYSDNTLGPRDSRGLAYGGNLLADASLALIFPNYLSESLRTSVFVDAGNVYTSLDNKKFGGLSSTSGPIRFSMGIEADWLTPFGPIQLSLAKPINNQRHRGTQPSDDLQIFQFSLGANF